MSKLDKDAVLDNFTKAYTEANGKAPLIEAKGGWYSVDGGKNMRLAQLDELRAELSSAKTAAKSEAKKSAPAKAVKATTENEAKPKAKKAKTTKAKGGKSFSVRDFYIQQIMAENQGVKAPR